MNISKSWIGTGVALALVLTVGACGSPSKSQSTAGEGALVEADTPAGKPMVVPGAPERNADSGQLPPGGLTVKAPLLQTSKLIKIGDLVMRVDDVNTQAAKATSIVLAAGGIVYEEKSNISDSTRATSDIVFKVPPASLERVLDELAASLGEKVSRTISTQDVTGEVADVNSRVASAKAGIDQLRGLYDKAKTVGEILQLERELSPREAELEALQATQRAYAAQTDTATLNLHLRDKDSPTPPAEDDDRGFLAGLEKGWDAFVDSAAWVATGIGALLPFAVLLLVLGGPAYLVLRRRLATQRPVAPAVD